MVLQVGSTTWKPLGVQTSAMMKAHDVICLHTMVGSLMGTDAYFRKDGYKGAESHFGMGGSGLTLQWQDLMREAHANLDGKSYVISIETADKGETFPTWTGSNVPKWTNQQVDKIVYLLDTMCKPSFHRDCPNTWTCHHLGIPRTLIPDTKPGRRGIGYHRQGVDPWRVAGGVHWSQAYGKVCPGDNRVIQLIDVIIPRVVALGKPVVKPPTIPILDDREEDMIIYFDSKAKKNYLDRAGNITEITKFPDEFWQLAGRGKVPVVTVSTAFINALNADTPNVKVVP